jgi:hypothetical protein
MVTGDTTTPASASTTSAPPTYSPAPISNGTYYIGAQSFGVVIDFKSASGNLTSSNFTGDLSQQVFYPTFYCVSSMDVDHNYYIVGDNQWSCITRVRVSEHSLQQLYFLCDASQTFLSVPKPGAVCLLCTRFQRRISVSIHYYLVEKNMAHVDI